MPTPTMLQTWMQAFAELFGIQRPKVLEANQASTIDVVVICNRDIYHPERQVLLLKTGQPVGPKTLDSLEKSGVSVLECCSIKGKNGGLEPLSLPLLRYMLQKNGFQTPTQPPQDTIISFQERRTEPVVKAWQRHFKVLIVAHNKRDQERLRAYLESQGVLSQHIHPVLQASMFAYLYEKYKPTCLIIDLQTHENFLKQHIDVLQRVSHCPFGCLENTILLTPSAGGFHPLEALTSEAVTQMSHPLLRQELEAVLQPLFKRLHCLDSNTPVCIPHPSHKTPNPLFT
jgi:hypothetical protein